VTDAIERRSAFKNAWIRHYRNERDRSEACIGDIMEALGDRDATDTETIEAILNRIIKHYDR
jgi:hypothetical protein